MAHPRSCVCAACGLHENATPRRSMKSPHQSLFCSSSFVAVVSASAMQGQYSIGSAQPLLCVSPPSFVAHPAFPSSCVAMGCCSDRLLSPNAFCFCIPDESPLQFSCVTAPPAAQHSILFFFGGCAQISISHPHPIIIDRARM